MSRLEAFMVAVGMILLGMAAARADIDYPRATVAQLEAPAPTIALP